MVYVEDRRRESRGSSRKLRAVEGPFCSLATISEILAGLADTRLSEMTSQSTSAPVHSLGKIIATVRCLVNIAPLVRDRSAVTKREPPTLASWSSTYADFVASRPRSHSIARTGSALPLYRSSLVARIGA